MLLKNVGREEIMCISNEKLVKCSKQSRDKES